MIARNLSGLPYRRATIDRQPGRYRSACGHHASSLHVEYRIEGLVNHKSVSDQWLTERYCLYMAKDGRIIRYDIHHEEWELHSVELDSLEYCYPFSKGLSLSEKPKYIHYSPGVKVLAWSRVVV